MLDFVQCPEEAGSTADTAHVPFSLGAVLPSAAASGAATSGVPAASGPRLVPSALGGLGAQDALGALDALDAMDAQDALFAHSRVPWADAATRQPQAAMPRGIPAEPQPTSQLSKQYPHTTRIAAGNGDAKGPHPARDPV